MICVVRPAGIRRAVVIVLAIGALSVVGCTSTGQHGTPRETAIRDVENMLPRLEINPDLTKPLWPSNDRPWMSLQSRLAKAEFHDNQVTIRNIRNCTYHTADNYEVDYYDKTFDLNTIESVDFLVIPFSAIPGVGHTMLSFGFADGQHVAVSVEIRKEVNEKYDPLKGFLNQYELLYLVADERDVIGVRVNHDMNDVYLYRTRATPESARSMFTSVLRRANKLAAQPEFYNTLTNNCTTNIVRHINEISPNRVRYDYRVLLPGLSDQLAYELGLLDTEESFEQTKREARVNYMAFRHRDSVDFSARIRDKSNLLR